VINFFFTIAALKLIVANCERSHLYLKKILPKVGNTIHDVNENVRLACVDLLAAVKVVRSIHYWEIVPLDELFLRLEVDPKQSVTNKIASLLHNSFFPVKDDPKDENKIERALYIVKKNRGAARRFYEHCQKQLNLHQCVKFILAVLAKLRTFVKEEMHKSLSESTLR
jgi:condensin-2 complex subunit G2